MGFEPQTVRRGPHVVRVGFCVVVPKRVSDGESRPSDCELIRARGGGFFFGGGGEGLLCLLRKLIWLILHQLNPLV